MVETPLCINMYCPTCGNNLGSYRLPFWDFDILYCSCGFFGNEPSVHAVKTGIPYKESIKRFGDWQKYEPFETTIESVEHINKLIMVCLDHAYSHSAEVSGVLQAIGVPAKFRNPQFLRHFTYMHKNWAIEHIGPRATKAFNTGIMIPMYAGPCLPSKVLLLAESKIKTHNIAKLNSSLYVPEGGLYQFIPGSKVIATYDYEIAAKLLAQQLELPSSKRVPFVLFDKEASKYCWKAFDLDEIIFLITDGLPRSLSTIRFEFNNIKFVNTNKNELLYGLQYLSSSVLLRQLVKAAKPLNAFLAEYVLHLDPEECRVAVESVGFSDFETTMFLESITNEALNTEVRERLDLNPNRVTYDGWMCYRYPSGGLLLEKANTRKEISDIDYRVSRIIECDDASYLSGVLRYQDRDIPVDLQFVDNETLKRDINQTCIEKILPPPKITTVNSIDWLDLCVAFSKPKLIRGYNKVGFCDETRRFILPNLVLTKTDAEEGPVHPPHFTTSAWSKPKTPDLLVGAIESTLKNTIPNRVFWAAFAAVAHYLMQDFYGPAKKILLVGNQLSLAGQIFEQFSSLLQMRGNSLLQNYPSLTSEEHIGSFNAAIPIEAYLLTLSDDFVLIPAMYKAVWLDGSQAMDLLCLFIQYILNHNSGGRGIFSLVADLSSFMLSTFNSSEVIDAARLSIFPYAMITKSAAYSVESLAVRLAVILHYLQDRGIFEPSVEEAGVVIDLDEFKVAVAKQFKRVDVDIAKLCDAFLFDGGLVRANGDVITVSNTFWTATSKGWTKANKVASTLEYNLT